MPASSQEKNTFFRQERSFHATNNGGGSNKKGTSPTIVAKNDNVNSEIKEATKEIEDLKAVIIFLKDENNKKVNLLLGVHHKELEDLKHKNITMKQKTEEQLRAIKNEIESLYEALEKSNKESVMLKNS